MLYNIAKQIFYILYRCEHKFLDYWWEMQRPWIFFSVYVEKCSVIYWELGVGFCGKGMRGS